MWEMVKDEDKSKCWLDLSEIGKRGKLYNWKNSIGCKIGIRYKWLRDEMEERWFEIIGYDKNTQKLTLKWSNEVYKINTNNLQKGNCGNIFDKITSNFQYEIGEVVKTNSGELTIIDRYYKQDKKGRQCKYYKYNCENNHEHEMTEGNLKKGIGCSVCANRTVLVGYNDLTTTHPHLVQYILNPEDAKKYTAQSNKKATLKCPFCGREKEMVIYTLVNRGFSCPNCSDGVPTTEKFMSNLLFLKNIDFIFQASKTNFDWIKNNKFYDFALPSDKVIIEIDGDLRSHGDKENDNYKDEMARTNGWSIVRINLLEERYTGSFEQLWSAYKPILNDLGIHITDEEAKECYIKSQTSIFHLVVQIANEHPEFSQQKIADELKEKYGYQLEKSTIGDYLKKSNELGLTNYTGNKKSVICITTGKYYKSCSEAERQTGIAGGSISANCRGVTKYAGKDENGNKLVWMFYSDYLKMIEKGA